MSTRARLAAHLPAFALEIRTPGVTLRFPDDEDLVELARLAAGGVHPDDQMPFTVPWSRVPSPFLERNTLQYFWSKRATLQSDAWDLSLVTLVDERIVGMQGLFATSWKATATFETGSWLGVEFQGQGIGKEMRVAALHLGFDGFGARRAVTAAFADNPSSLGVTRALGYRPNGDAFAARDEDCALIQHFAMDRSDFDARRRDDVEIVGAADVLALFGTEHVPGA